MSSGDTRELIAALEAIRKESGPSKKDDPENYYRLNRCWHIAVNALEKLSAHEDAPRREG